MESVIYSPIHVNLSDSHGEDKANNDRLAATLVSKSFHQQPDHGVLVAFPFWYDSRFMSVAPMRLPGPEREPPFDDAVIRKYIADLLVQDAGEVESDQLEIKGWCNNERELADKVAEACACIANTSGGFVLVGVADCPTGGRKFSPCPHSAVNVSWLQTSIHNFTRPPVQCTPIDISGILSEVIGIIGNNLYAIRVPKTRCISGHVTTKGVSKIRIGKQCHPQFLAEDDRTNVPMPHIRLDDLSSLSIDWGISQHHKRFGTSSAWADRAEFLAQAGLVKPHLDDQEYLPEFQPTFAALLLFGKAPVIARDVPFFETVVEADGKYLRIRKNVIESVRDLCIGDSSILRSRLPQIPPDVLKELVVNAYVHRCYRTPGPIVISISESTLEIRSPGELLTGLSVSNLIYGVPVYRNLLLADGARYIGLCDKIGHGIDLIFKGVVSGGLAIPEFESGDNLFVARIPLTDSPEFKEFVRKRSQALGQLDEVIVISVLWRRSSVTLEDLASTMQRKREYAEGVLREMCKKLVIEMEGHDYRLTDAVRQDIQTIFQSDQLPLLPL
jgi:ATP-dependent DNA helicase RecG